MKELTLVVMAAGMGSRFGGLKQIEPIDKFGHVLIDYSLYDACLSGFTRVLFVIKKEIESDFKNVLSPRFSRLNMKVDYVYQEMSTLPLGYYVPKERKKPWGTAHAIACLSGLVDKSFAVINADDFYGRDAFFKMSEFLGDGREECSMIGYKLEDTLSKSGGVSRGVCRVEQGTLRSINEMGGIERINDAIFSNGNIKLKSDIIVSMNFWGLTSNVVDECRLRFADFLKANLTSDPLKCEFYLPEVISRLINEGKIKVNVINSLSKWYGVTYKKDKSEVSLALEQMIENGLYPAKLC